MQSNESGHSWVMWVTGTVPTHQSPGSINERWSWGRVALPVWLRPLCSCHSPPAKSRCSHSDDDMRQPDGATPEGARGKSDSLGEWWGSDRCLPFPPSPWHANRGRVQGWQGGWQNNAEEERRIERMMDDVRTSLSKEQLGENEKWHLRGWEELQRPQSLP